jgi:hypothetical protein
MRAHLLPLAAATATAPPAGALASCRLEGADGGWLLALTDRSGPYEVEEVLSRPGGGTDRAVLVTFEGPRDATQVAADRRSNRDRAWPAASQVDGVAGSLTLRGDDGAMVVIAFAASDAAHEAAREAILSTPLLPGEDPLLLRGPDSSTACAVTDDGVGELLRSAAVPA